MELGTLIYSAEWDPNTVYDEDVFKYDWRGRRGRYVRQWTLFEENILHDPEEKLETGCLVIVIDERDHVNFEAKALLFAHCPIEDSTKATISTSSAKLMSNFIGPFCIPIFHRSLDDEPSEYLEKTLFQSV